MSRKFTPERIDELKPDEIFVFGSNMNGAHMGGAARIAYENFEATWGESEGLNEREVIVDQEFVHLFKSVRPVRGRRQEVGVDHFIVSKKEFLERMEESRGATENEAHYFLRPINKNRFATLLFSKRAFGRVLMI